MVENNIRAVVLAAGKATRFKSKKSKLLFDICDQAMIMYPLKALEELAIPTTLVVGHQAEDVKALVTKSAIPNITFVQQEQQLGTGHAVACTAQTWDRDNILILYGDMPLLSSNILQNLISEHYSYGATISFLTSYVVEPTGYGRVVHYKDGFQVIEEKDCDEQQRSIHYINAGVYIMKKSFLDSYIKNVEKSLATGEVYLPELLKMAADQGLAVFAKEVPFDNIRGANTLQELWEAEQIKRAAIIKHWMLQGVRFELAQSINVGIDVKIGAGTFIGAGTHLMGNTIIGEECFISPFAIIENSIIDDNATIFSHSVIQDSHVCPQAQVGPFAHLRNNTTIHAQACIGNFVEVKNSIIGCNTKAKHLSFLGDATIGNSVNIGAGTITCNYDGTEKHKTIIQENAFIGSNTTLIAPINIGTNAYLAAGSTITDDVPDQALAIARTQQTNKDGYVSKLKGKKKDSLASKGIGLDSSI